MKSGKLQPCLWCRNQCVSNESSEATCSKLQQVQIEAWAVALRKQHVCPDFPPYLLSCRGCWTFNFHNTLYFSWKGVFCDYQWTSGKMRQNVTLKWDIFLLWNQHDLCNHAAIQEWITKLLHAILTCLVFVSLTMVHWIHVSHSSPELAMTVKDMHSTHTVPAV